MENHKSFLLSKTGSHNGLKTELSLGLPGFESPEKKQGVTIFGKDFEASIGSKRGFSHVSEEWVLSMNGGSNGIFDKDCVLAGNLGVLDKGSDVISCPKSCVEKKLSDNSAARAQVVGWPPIRSFRKNTMASTCAKNNGNTVEKSVSECLYVKVSMDGAPYLRKVDLQIYGNYVELSSALEKMFSCFISGQYGKRDGSEGHSTEYLRTSESVLTYEDKDGDWMLVGDVPWKMFKENCRKLRIMKGSEAIGPAPNATEKGMIPD